MKCEHCDSEIAENEKFCGECGAPRPSQATPPAGEAQGSPVETINSATKIPISNSSQTPISGVSSSQSRLTILKRHWKLIFLAAFILVLQLACCFQLVNFIKQAVWDLMVRF